MNKQEKRKIEIILEYRDFALEKSRKSIAFYADRENGKRCFNYLREFRQLRPVFTEIVKNNKLFLCSYSDCIVTYIEFFLRERGFLENNIVYKLPSNYKDSMDELFELADECFEVLETFNNTPCYIEGAEDDYRRLKRLALQKMIASLVYCFEEYKDRFLKYANEAVEMKSIQGYSALVLYYCSFNHVDLEKANKLLNELLPLPLTGGHALNNYSQIVAKISALSILYYTYFNKEDNIGALTTAHLCREYLISDETKIIEDSARKELIEIADAFILSSSKRFIKKQTKDKKVFISYSSKNKDIVDDIESSLKKQGVASIWRDTEKIEGGDSFIREIPNNIESCDIFLVVLSEDAEQSPWVEREVRLAIDAKKKMVVYKIGRYDSSIEFMFMLGPNQFIYDDQKDFDELAIFIKNKIDSF